MTEGNIYRIVFTKDMYRIKKGIKTFKTVKLKNDQSINYPEFYEKNDIRFTYAGAPNRGGTVIIMDNSLNYYYKITIVPSSGRVKMYKIDK